MFPEHFRRVLNGQHPFTNEYLVSSQGSAVRAWARTAPGDCEQLDELPDSVDTLRAAAHLGVSSRYVTGLLVTGATYRTKLATAGEGVVVPEPSAYLFGDKADGSGRYGSVAWSLSRKELERFVERRIEAKARPGYDLALRPPKSVSVLWALAEPERRVVIREVHREAVDEVVRYYETNRCSSASVAGGRGVWCRRVGVWRRRLIIARRGLVIRCFIPMW